MSAKRPRTSVNPNLARSHLKGATAEEVRPLAHRRYGALGYIPSDGRFVIHYEVAEREYRVTEKHFATLINSQLAQSGIRIFKAERGSTLNVFLRSGFSLILNSWLTIESLILDFSSQLEKHGLGNEFTKFCMDNGRPREKDVLAALDEIAVLYQIDKIDRTLRNQISQLEAIQNNLMHPRPLQGSPEGQAQWDNDPIAWLLSEKRRIAIDVPRAVIEHFRVDRLARQRVEQQLTSVERGIEFTDPVKKVYEPPEASKI